MSRTCRRVEGRWVDFRRFDMAPFRMFRIKGWKWFSEFQIFGSFFVDFRKSFEWHLKWKCQFLFKRRFPLHFENEKKSLIFSRLVLFNDLWEKEIQKLSSSWKLFFQSHISCFDVKVFIILNYLTVNLTILWGAWMLWGFEVKSSNPKAFYFFFLHKKVELNHFPAMNRNLMLIWVV